MSEKQPIISTAEQQLVVTLQPQQHAPEFAPGREKLVCPVEGHRTWSSGLCECTNDVADCILTFFCHPCVLCQLAGRMNEFACLPCCVPQAQLAMRTRLRTLGGIQGSICNDCMVVSCCPHLAACQMKREMDDMKLY